MPKRRPCLLALVGEAGGEEEQEARRPFVGPAGRLLDRLLHHAGIPREQCLVTNVFDVKLPRNSVRAIGIRKSKMQSETKKLSKHRFPDHYRASVETGTYIPPAIADVILERLYNEIAEANPVVIVPLGGTAIWAVLGVSPVGAIKQMQGTCALAPWLFNKPVVPAYHPAAALRDYKLTAFIIAALERAMSIVKAGGQFPSPPRVYLCDDPADLDQFMAEANAVQAPLAIDIETRGHRIDCIGFACNHEYALVVPFENDDGSSYWPDVITEAAVLQRVAALLTSSLPKVFQKGDYDVTFIKQAWGISVVNWLDDTRLMAHARYPELPRDLSTQASLWLPWAIPWKAEYKRSQSSAEK